MAYLTLFAWSFAAATILPLGSEPAVVYLVTRGADIRLVVLVATLGNYLGACTTYAMARAVRHRFRADPGPRAARATRLVSAYGAPALALSWVPIVGDAIVLAAGAAGISFTSFSIWTIAGKLARYVAVAYGARALTIG